MTDQEIMQLVATGKPYTLLILKTGPTPPPQDEAEANRLQMEHLGYLFQMEKEGKSSVFGPIGVMRSFEALSFSTRQIRKMFINGWPTILG